MKKSIIYLFFALSICPTFSQNDVFDESLNTLNKIHNILIDCIASFMEFPENHSNTELVFERINEIKEFYEQQQSIRYNFSNNILSNPKVKEYFSQIDKMKVYASTFIELLRPFMGYNSAGLTLDQMAILNPLFQQMNWSIELLDINCKNARFYEYSLKGCKMMFINNTLPSANYNTSEYNDIEVDFTYTNGGGGRWYVRGGKYRMIQFKDDKNIKYYRVIKAFSEMK